MVVAISALAAVTAAQAGNGVPAGIVSGLVVLGVGSVLAPLAWRAFLKRRGLRIEVIENGGLSVGANAVEFTVSARAFRGITVRAINFRFVPTRSIDPTARQFAPERVSVRTATAIARTDLTNPEFELTNDGSGGVTVQFQNPVNVANDTRMPFQVTMVANEPFVGFLSVMAYTEGSIRHRGRIEVSASRPNPSAPRR